MDWENRRATFLRYREGDAAAADAVFRELALPLQRFFRARTGSHEDALDLAQATLLKLHFARDRYDAARPLKTWVFTVASRTLIDVWRGAKERATHAGGDGAPIDPDEIASELPSHEKILEYGDALLRALATLQPIDRSIVYLSGVEQMSVAEVAESLGITESAAKTRAHRAHAKLRVLLAELGGDAGGGA